MSPARSEEAAGTPFNYPIVDLLLTTWTLLRFVRGERLAHLKETYMRAAHSLAQPYCARADGALPASPREAAIALHDAVVELGECLGVEAAELAAAYNARREGGLAGNPARTDEAIERMTALASVLIANRLKAP